MQEEIKPIDIEAIMAEIKQNIEERGYKEKDLVFAQFADDYKRQCGAGSLPLKYDAADFADKLRQYDCVREIIPWKVLHGNKIKVFIQKVIRRAIRFYVDPVVTEQNRNNYLIAYLIAQLELKNNQAINNDEINELKKQVLDLQKEVEELKKKSGDQ